jgi:hypothetical protein
MKEPNEPVEHTVAAPRTVIYHRDDNGALQFVRTSHDWPEVTHEDEAFFLCAYGHGLPRLTGHRRRCRRPTSRSPMISICFRRHHAWTAPPIVAAIHATRPTT